MSTPPRVTLLLSPERLTSELEPGRAVLLARVLHRPAGGAWLGVPCFCQASWEAASLWRRPEKSEGQGRPALLSPVYCHLLLWGALFLSATFSFPPSHPPSALPSSSALTTVFCFLSHSCSSPFCSLLLLMTIRALWEGGQVTTHLQAKLSPSQKGWLLQRYSWFAGGHQWC